MDARDLVRFRTVFLGVLALAGLLALQLLFLGREAASTGGPPAPRGDGSNRAVGYDETNNRMMFFGGYTTGVTLLNDTWVLVGADGTAGAPQWVQLATVNTPAPHRHHAGAYDPVNNRLIVYGGCLGQCTPLDDNVYVLSNANGLGGTPAWQQLSPSGGPPTSRDAHTAVYDPNSNRLIVFGGDNCCGGRFNDTWVLTNANGLGGAPTWQQLSPSGGPPPARSHHSAVYDSANNRMIVFGGANCCGAVLSDSWLLTNANGLGGTPTWTQLVPSGTSPPRSQHAAVYDGATNRMVVFGGDDGMQAFNDTWVLTNANGLGGTPAWIQSAPSGTLPSPRGASNAVYRQVTNRMVIFGGNELNDTWVLTSASAQGSGPEWIQLVPTVPKPQPLGGSAAYPDLPSGNGGVLAGVVAGSAAVVLTLGGAAWYARRRRSP